MKCETDILEKLMLVVFGFAMSRQLSLSNIFLVKPYYVAVIFLTIIFYGYSNVCVVHFHSMNVLTLGNLDTARVFLFRVVYDFVVHEQVFGWPFCLLFWGCGSLRAVTFMCESYFAAG